MVFSDLGEALAMRGEYAEAMEHYDRSLALHRTLKPSHVLAFAMALLAKADLLQRTMQPAAAEAAAREAVDAVRAGYGGPSAMEVDALSVLAGALFHQKRNPEAAAVLDDAWELSVARNGEQSVASLDVLHSQAMAHLAMGDLAAAEPRFVRCVELSRALGRADHAYTAKVLANYADLPFAAGRLDEAEARMREGLALAGSFDEPVHRELMVARLGRILALTGPSADGGLTFERGGGPRFTMGGVTGIDSAGRCARGMLRVTGGEVELTLPAAFVDDAAYPLLLDPLVQPAFELGDADVSDAPDVAFDEHTKRYLMTFHKPSGLYGRLFDEDGNPASLTFPIASAPALPFFQPLGPSAVTSSYVAEAFLVAWVDATHTQIVVRAVVPATATLTKPLTVVTSTGIAEVDLGGSPDSFVSNAVVAWIDSTQDLLVQRIQFTPGPKVAVVQARQQVAWHADPSAKSHVRVSERAGVEYWIMTWQVSSQQEVDVAWSGIHRFSGMLGPAEFAFNEAGVRESRPEVACGKFQDWVILCRREHKDGVEIVARGGGLGDHTYEMDDEYVVVLGGDHDPGRALIGGSYEGLKYIVAWEERTAGGAVEIRATGLDNDTCVPCATPYVVEPADPQYEVRLSRLLQRDGDIDLSAPILVNPESLVAFTRTEVAAAVSKPHAFGAITQEFGAGGTVVVHASECPNGLTVHPFEAPAIGDDWFGLWVGGFQPQTPFAYVNFGVPAAPAWWCGCWIYDWQHSLLYATQTNDFGERYIWANLPVPCEPVLIGTTVRVQILEGDGWGNVCGFFAPGLRVSPPVDITYGE